MPRSLLVAFCLFAFALPVAAEENGTFLFGEDAFAAGQTVTHEIDGVDDLFIAGQRVRVESDVTGSVHAIGQSVRLIGDAGGDVYIAAQEADVTGDIAGDLSVIGQDIIVEGGVGNSLRAAGALVEIKGLVGGYAILAGEEVRLGGEIAGDVSLAGNEVVFQPDARIGGMLTLYEDDGEAVDVPASVVSPDRIVRVPVEEWAHEEWDLPGPSTGQIIGRFLGGVLMIAVIAVLIATLMPERLADMRRALLDRPFRSLGIGFLAQSALIGSTIVVSLTLIGLLLVPAILVLAGFVAVAGYVIGAYAFGVGLTLIAGRDEPDSVQDRAIAAGIGALAVGLLGLVPILGWIFILALALAGVGVIVEEIASSRRSNDAEPV